MIGFIMPVLIAACSAHAPARVHYSDIRSAEVEYREGSHFFTTGDEVSADTLLYSKKINYWVNGKWVGRGKYRHYVPGHWEKRIAVPPSDHGYVWVPGHYTKRPRNGRARGYVPGHWEKVK